MQGGMMKNLCGYWGTPGNHLYVANACCRDKKEDARRPVVGGDAVINHMMWDADMHKGKLRNLASESRVVFLEVQKVVARGASKQSDPQLTSQLLNLSHQYLSAIKASTAEIQGLLRFEKNQKERETLEEHMKMLEMIELLWGLCEVVFIDDSRGGYVLDRLLDWLRLRFYDSDVKVQEVIESHRGEQHGLYWEAMFTFVLQGRIEEARRLLLLHSKSKSETYVRIGLLLEQMPAYVPSDPRLSFNEWLVKWEQWHITCLEHLEDGMFSEDPNLTLLCKILAGQDQAFVELNHLLGTWYCLLISKLFYQSPMVSASDLRHYTQFCIDAFGGIDTMTSWDDIILSILHLDTKQAVDKYCCSFNNWWFVCHMTDLLEHRGCLDSKILPFGSTLREFIVIEYAYSLISDPSLLEVGIDYLSHCPAFGRAHIAELVVRAHLETDMKVRKMLRICEKYELNEQASIICREQGLKDLRHGLVGCALTWCIRSKDAGLAVIIVKKILLDGLVPAQKLSELDFINNFGLSIGFSNELAFLGKLAEYQRHFSQAMFEKAATTLYVLFSERTSKRFWPFLFDRLCALLDVEEVILTKMQTTKFLECLAEYELLGVHGDVTDKKLPRDQVLRMRQLLAESLALSLIIT